MDLRQLRQFIAVAEELHFSRAAARLNMTQPPLSQSIQALEAQLQVTLFVRTKRSVALTAVGAAWLDHVRRVVAAADALPDIAGRLSRGEIGTLRLGFVSTADYNLLPVLVSRFGHAFPEVELQLREMTSDHQIQALLDRQIDAGLVIPAGQPLHGSLDYLPLRSERLVAAVPTAWADARAGSRRRRPVSVAELRQHRLLLFPRASAPAFHDLVTQYYGARGAEPQFGQQAIQMQTLISLVSAGLGVALVPESMRNLARTGVSYLSLREAAPPLMTGIAWRRDSSVAALQSLLAIAAANAAGGLVPKSGSRARR